MIFVLDTNIIVSAMVFGGTPKELVMEIVRQGHILATCAEILAEMEDVFQRKRIAQAIERAGIPPPSIHIFARMAIHFIPKSIPRTVRDPDDDVILGCALAAQADAVVSGDKDLLELGNYCDIPILTVAQAFKLVRTLETR